MYTQWTYIGTSFVFIIHLVSSCTLFKILLMEALYSNYKSNLLSREVQLDIWEAEVSADASFRRRVRRGWLLQIGAQDSETLVHYSLYT